MFFYKILLNRLKYHFSNFFTNKNEAYETTFYV